MSDCFPTGPYIFSYAVWAARFPNFSQTVGPDLAQAYFDEACVYVDNTGCSVIYNTNTRGLILNLIVAHLAQLNTGVNGSTASALVGRITDASEGSVSVSADMGAQGPAGGSVNWYNQTAWGAQAWQMMSPFRLGGRYSPSPRRNFGINGPFYGYSGYLGRN